MIHGFVAVSPAVSPADRTDQQQQCQHARKPRENPARNACDALHLIQPFRLAQIGGHLFRRRLRRRHQRRFRRHRGRRSIGNRNPVALKDQGLLQLVYSAGGELEGTRHADVHIPAHGARLARGDAVEGIYGCIHRPDPDVLHIHSALVMYPDRELHRARNPVHLFAVRFRFHAEHNLLGRIGCDDAHAAGRRFHRFPGFIHARHRELQILAFSDGDFLFQRHRFALGYRHAGKNFPQRRVRHLHIREIHRSGVLQRKRQLDRIPRSAALLVSLQRCPQLDFAVLDRCGFHPAGVGFPAGFVGHRSRAGQIPAPHRRGKSMFLRFSRGDRGNGHACAADSGVFFDADARHIHCAGIGDFIGNADLLILLRCQGRNRPVDAQLRLAAGIDNPLGEVLFLQGKLIIVIIDHIFDFERDLPGIQLILRHGPRAAPGFRYALAQDRRAEFFHLLAAGIVQRHLVLHIRVAHVGHADGNADGFGRAELVVAQLHGNLQRIIRRQGGRNRHQQRRQDNQGRRQEYAFLAHVTSEPSGLLPPSAAGKIQPDTFKGMGTKLQGYFNRKPLLCQADHPRGQRLF